MEDEHVPTADDGVTPEATVEATVKPPAPLALSPASASSAEPRAPDAAQTDTPPGDGGANDASPARRGVKLVVTLRPDDGASYRAVLALGADGCDPLLRAAAVDGLQAALDEVQGLLAEAEARWAEQPRNPATRPARAARPTAGRSPAAMPEPAATETVAPAPPTGPGQLSLFG